MKKLILIASIVVISFVFLNADVYIKQKTAKRNSTGALAGEK